MKEYKWIWYPGDFEIYHSNLVHARREDFGMQYPPMWMQYSPYPRVTFQKTAVSAAPGTLTVHTHARCGHVLVDGERYAVNRPIPLAAGQHTVTAALFDTAGLPGIFVEDEAFGTDESWSVSNGSASFFPAACTPAYTRATDDPTVFCFCYDTLQPVAMEKADGGVLYDYGKETFGPVELTGCNPGAELFICYGESREEALDAEYAFIKQTLKGQASYQLSPRAFRYIFIRGEGAGDCSLTARYEYLPLQDVGRFACENPFIEKIYQVCAYTFHLNSREFFQDGIKRDRWVWSGDSYQSYMTNNYLYFNPDITKRTIRCLLGKPPYEQHVNTINDYTLYLILGLWDTYFATGDRAFVAEVWPRFKALYQFVTDRLDEDGQMVYREGDWIFIDWSDMDKDGPLCAEQILLWKTARCMAQLAGLMGEPADRFEQQAARLEKLINQRYWSEEKQAYIDTYTSGKNNVTRHANIFAILYDFADDDRKAVLKKTVLDNDEIIQITTPYFKFFELCARCKLGDLPFAQKMIENYWGGMLNNGATSIWEEYDPNATGTQHLAMYGDKYGCSLCHAWGGGPIYLLGRYCLGVVATDVAYKTFTVAPQLGIYKELHGAVPLAGGQVTVDYADGVLKVFTDCEGGTLIAGGRQFPLQKGVALQMNIQL